MTEGDASPVLQLDPATSRPADLDATQATDVAQTQQSRPEAALRRLLSTR